METMGRDGPLSLAEVTGSGCVFFNPVQRVLLSHMEAEVRATAAEQYRVHEVKGQAILF